jgi:type II pantothenate kinase
LIPKAAPSSDERVPAASAQLGVDVGASLVKLAIRHRDGALELRSISLREFDRIPREIAALAPDCVGLTGGGSARLLERLPRGAVVANEFAAWGTGARAILRRAGDSFPDRFLLVSVGTGTSAILVTSDGADRIGGTALGGGTVAGLASALVGTADAGELAALARAGDRRRVDLQVAEIYTGGEAPLPREMNAASFAKLAERRTGPPPTPGDLVRAVMGLVGENIALICGGLAISSGVDRIVYGGTTLQGNPVIGDILRAVAPAHGCAASILPDGAFPGAVGAMELAAGE